MFKLFNLTKKVQSTLEYAALIAIVVGALIAMQAYIKRGLQGKMKASSDQISSEHFSAQLTTGITTSNTTINITENLAIGGNTTSDTDRDTKIVENYTTAGLHEEKWPGSE